MRPRRNCAPGRVAAPAKITSSIPAAHRGGPVFAHHPAQRLEQVRLAAAIRADHPGQAGRDHQIGRIDEAVQPQS
jgi:hypothetical protein